MNEQANDGGPAFPVIAENGLGHVSDGMSLRDWFAGQALTSAKELLFSTQGGAITGWPESVNVAAEIASRAYLIADAMLVAREGRAS